MTRPAHRDGGGGSAAPRFSRLSDDECARLHEASLSILAKTGVRLLEPRAVELLRRAGARVDGDRVWITSHLVERALGTVPREVTLHDRTGEARMALRGTNTYFGPGSDCLNIIDHRTNERRRAVLQDVVDGITTCDALENISFAMSMFFPSDVPQEFADRYQAEVLLSRTTKPIVFVTYEMSGCRDAVEMAELVAGSADALRAKPFIACYINVTSGLLHNADSLQKLLFLAEKGLPALYIPVVSGGTTGPMTIAGGVAATNAGVLTGIVLSQLAREGAPMIIPGFAGDSLDMRTMVDPYCSPDPRGWAESLGHYYGLPIFTLGGASESKVVDQQAGIEATLTMMVAAHAGGHLFHDCGYLESGLTGSLAQLAICDQIAGWIKAFRRPVEIDDESLALALIDQVGPEGSFLALPHTRRHMRERWYPSLFERENFGGWQSHGALTLAERASARVTRILEEHHPSPLPPDVAAAIRRIVERAAPVAAS
jgi:trimethylamine--corrinoid protein Co-methyltransferase